MSTSATETRISAPICTKYGLQKSVLTSLIDCTQYIKSLANTYIEFRRFLMGRLWPPKQHQIASRTSNAGFLVSRFWFCLAKVKAVTRGDGGEAKDDYNQVSRGRQDDATEPHPLKTKGDKLFGRYGERVWRDQLRPRVLVSSAGHECASHREWALWRMGADLCFFNRHLLMQCQQTCWKTWCH